MNKWQQQKHASRIARYGLALALYHQDSNGRRSIGWSQEAKWWRGELDLAEEGDADTLKFLLSKQVERHLERAERP